MAEDLEVEEIQRDLDRSGPMLRFAQVRSMGFLVLFLWSESACISAYSPPAPVAPFLDEVGEVVIGGTASPLPRSLGATVYMAAAPTQSTRVFGSGSLTRTGGRSVKDEGETISGHNDTEQGEVGAGYGLARRHLVLEALTGGGYGHTKSAPCRQYLGDGFCSKSSEIESHFARYFAQLNIAGNGRTWVAGGGVRMSLVHFMQIDVGTGSLDDSKWMPALEPFITARYGFSWGKLELGVHAPIVLSSPEVRFTNTGSDATPSRTITRSLASTPVPRLLLGFQVNLEQLWHKGTEPP